MKLASGPIVRAGPLNVEMLPTVISLPNEFEQGFEPELDEFPYESPN